MKRDYRIVDSNRLDALTKKARLSPRLRMNDNLHELPDKVQRFLNAIEPLSYVRPHRHLHPPKHECFAVLRGRLAVILFADGGAVSDIIRLDGQKTPVIDLDPAVWHTIVSLESGSVILEVKDGPYEPASDKDFAPWSPAEDDPGAKDYLELLTVRVLKG